ncbi:MAG: site-specific integrase [Clostridia bacterium]|nr:site-specific integrase [Clostridia bacterium]
MTFAEISIQILDEVRLTSKSSTYVSYRSILFKRLRHISDVEIEDFDKKALLSLRAELLDSSAARNTISSTWSMIGKVLSYAAYEYGIDTPWRAYKSIKTISKERRVKTSWTKEEWIQFSDTVLNLYVETGKEVHYRYYVLFNYMYYMANRKGETMALKVEKIDLDNRMAIIDESISYKVLPGYSNQYVTTDRKNHKPLYEVIPKPLVSILREYIDTYKLGPHDYLFFRDRPIPPETLRRKMDWYIERAGVRRITPHQFRHTHASVIFASGESKIEDAYVVAKRLGHSVKYTLDTYGSLYEDREYKIIDRL